MLIPRFILQNPKSKTSTLIFMVLRYKGQVLKVSTREKVHPKYWNANQRCVGDHEEFPEGEEINNTLEDYADNVKKAYRNFGRNYIPSVPELRQAFEKLAFPNQVPTVDQIKKQTFISFIEDIIKSSSDKKNSTISTYQTTLSHLKEYGFYHKKTLDFSEINMEFYYEFTKFMFNQGKSNNTTGKYIKIIKSFLHLAEEKKIEVSQEFKNKKFKVLREDADTIYLNLDELEEMYQLDLSNNKVLKETRDLFILGAFTGLRYSDFSNIHRGNIIKLNDKPVIKMQTKKSVGGKNGETVIIPLFGRSKDILQRYHFNLPTYSPDNPISKHLQNDAMNVNLKKIGKMLKWNEISIVNKTIGKEQISRSLKKYERIQTHTARRSFATNAYLIGIPTISIMKITGHKTEKSFLRYIRISAEDNAIKLMQYEFGNKI